MSFYLLLISLFMIYLPNGYGENAIASEQSKITFNTHIQSIFQKHCLVCHKSRFFSQAGLRLDSVKSILNGGDSGPAVIKGSPEESLIVKSITASPSDPRRMPPAGNAPLSSEEIDLIKKWIQQGVE